MTKPQGFSWLGLSKINKKKALRLQDSILHPFLFTLYCYVLEGNEIHISDFFVGMKYSISLLDLYLNASLLVNQLFGILVLIIGLTSPRSWRFWTTTTR